MNEKTKEEKEEFEKRLKIIVGGFCYSQDGGNGGYDFKDIISFIEKLETKNYKKGIADMWRIIYEEIGDEDGLNIGKELTFLE
jgi:hypothetical protein